MHACVSVCSNKQGVRIEGGSSQRVAWLHHTRCIPGGPLAPPAHRGAAQSHADEHRHLVNLDRREGGKEPDFQIHTSDVPGAKSRRTRPPSPGPHLIPKVPHEYAKVVLRPLHQRWVHPPLPRRLPHDCHLFLTLAVGRSWRGAPCGGHRLLTRGAGWGRSRSRRSIHLLRAVHAGGRVGAVLNAGRHGHLRRRDHGRGHHGGGHHGRGHHGRRHATCMLGSQHL